MLYICTVILVIYRLRLSGAKLGRFELQRSAPVLADVRMEAIADRRGEQVARAFRPRGSQEEVLPPLRVERWRLTSGLLLSGQERIFRGVKSKGETHRQAWFCVTEARDFGPLLMEPDDADDPGPGFNRPR